MVEQSQILESARSWVGTKFHHQGRKKLVGVDCIGLIIGVAQELGLNPPDKLGYAREPRKNALEETLDIYLREGELIPSNIVLFKIDKYPQHVGILSNYGSELGIIHAYAQARKVVEHELNDWWKERIVKTYSFPEEKFC